MSLSTFISNRLTPAGSFTGASSERPALDGSGVPDHTSCRFEIARLVSGIENSEVRGVIETVFKDLLRLLESLGLIESHLRQISAAEENFALFQIINDEARALVKYIREDGLNCPAMSEEIIDTLDGITFAVNHDLQRVFEFEELRISTQQTDQLVVGKLSRAHDLLTNCLQQSTITLALMFDPALVGSKLFNNSDIRRYWESLQLCDDLTALSQQIEYCETHLNDPSFVDLSSALEKFRNESLECLNYSDWPQFESFCETIIVTGTSWLQLQPVLHQFRCYVDTLLGHVKRRAVLNQVPVQVDRDVNDSATPDHQPAWDPFAIAV